MDVRATRVSGLERVWAERVEQTRVRESSRPATRESTSVEISEQAGFLGQLSALKQNDPQKFRHVLGAVSANLTAAANPQSGQVGNDLGALARKLDQVARTGDLSRLGELAPASAQNKSRAIEAYLRNARPPAPAATDTSRQALQYVMNAIAEANQDVAPAGAAVATARR